MLYPILPILTQVLHASGGVVGVVEGIAEATECRSGFLGLALGQAPEKEGYVLLQWGLAFLTKRRRVRVLPVEPLSAQRFIDPILKERSARSL
jgi:hypothetical protein